MNAKYILRFDDFCPAMNWVVWEQIESILNKHNIKPIIAVVPDNRDPKLNVAPPREDFWEKVRAWQAAGWTIAIHGYQHVYSTQNSGLTKINKYSEFAGLSYEEQRDKLEKGLAIFAKNNVRADAWIAPAHAFDENTVKALLDLNINVISDGYYFRPVKRLGALWIPQQLWQFQAMRFGLWTICFHHNAYSVTDIIKFERDVEKYASNIVAFNQVTQDFATKDINLLDNIMEKFWHIFLRFKTKCFPVYNRIKKLLGTS
jgi:predicted deacetylase